MYTIHTTITNTVRSILQFHTHRSARVYPPPMFCNRPSTTCPLSKYRNAQLVKHELSVRLNDDPGAYVMHFSKHVSVSLATTSLKTALRFSSCASKDKRKGGSVRCGTRAEGRVRASCVVRRRRRQCACGVGVPRGTAAFARYPPWLPRGDEEARCEARVDIDGTFYAACMSHSTRRAMHVCITN